MTTSHGLKIDGTQFWVTHRRREYGPFDYDYSKDYHGIELLYQGQKFGEYITSVEIFADLRQFKLPMAVVEVASIALGSILYGLLNGLNDEEKQVDLERRLLEHGLDRFAGQIKRKPDAA